MRKLLFLMLFIFLSSLAVFSQDTIVRTNGEKVLCKIQKEDAMAVYFSVLRDGMYVSTFLNKSEIASLKYGPTQEKIVSQTDNLALGFGLGLDYGGIGVNFLFYPQKNIGLFAGGGYAIAGFGYNVGAKFRAVSKKPQSITPFAEIMYGYNAAIAVVNAESLNKIFYGMTLGFGLDYKRTPLKKGYWSFALLIPLRGSEVDNYIDDLKKNYTVEMKNQLLPFAISVGYRIH